MIDTSISTSLGRRLWDGIRQDTLGFMAAVAPVEPPAPGLYTYRITPMGGKVRIHLRIEADGSGVLFVDVTDAVHLNPTAAEMAKMALDGVSPDRAKAVFASRYRDAVPSRVTAELDQIYEMVRHFANPGSGCATCSIDSLQRAALFSTPVQAPYKADIALTYGCNNECPHCYNEADRLGMASLPAEDWKRALDRLAEVGVPHLIFTGGEATLHPDLPELIAYADSLGPIVGLNSNGRRIAHLPYMQTLADAGLNHLQITLGSHNPAVHDAMMGAVSFQQTLRGIENAVASSVHVITNTTLMRVNMGHAEEIIEFLYSLGIRTFAMNGMIYSGGGFAHPNAIPEESMPALLVRVRDRAAELGMRFLWYTPTEYCRMSPVELEIGAKRCNAGEYSLCIEPNGDVLPCQSYYVAAGNILRDPWEQIWNGALFRSFREREADPRWSGLPEKCWDCPDLPLCGGGCRIEREARDGNRVADGAGGGCSGCSGACGTAHHANPVPTAGFIPSEGMISTARRATGNMPGLIPLEALDLSLPMVSKGHVATDFGHLGEGLIPESRAGGCSSGTCACR
jgi:radical SAM protein with 4Fe4S-binding SPASM domain